jgi:hypothetical protein
MKSSMNLIFTAAVLTSIFSLSAFAQLAPCSAGQGYKIWIDDVRAQTPQVATWSPIVSWALNDMLISIRKRSEHLSNNPITVNIFPCAGRHPASGDLFSDQVLGPLNTSNVVLELWGDLLDFGPNSTRLSVGYILIPVRILSHNEGSRASKTKLSAPQNPDEVLALLRHQQTIEAYYDVAIGTKLFAENQWASAPAYLCRGVALMQNSAADTDLVQYSRTLAIEASRRAAASTQGTNIFQLRKAGSDPCEAAKP